MLSPHLICAKTLMLNTYGIYELRLARCSLRNSRLLVLLDLASTQVQFQFMGAC
jgi:hypothetical protein